MNRLVFPVIVGMSLLIAGCVLVNGTETWCNGQLEQGEALRARVSGRTTYADSDRQVVVHEEGGVLNVTVIEENTELYYRMALGPEAVSRLGNRIQVHVAIDRGDVTVADHHVEMFVLVDDLEPGDYEVAVCLEGRARYGEGPDVELKVSEIAVS